MSLARWHSQFKSPDRVQIAKSSQFAAQRPILSVCSNRWNGRFAVQVTTHFWDYERWGQRTSHRFIKSRTKGGGTIGGNKDGKCIRLAGPVRERERKREALRTLREWTAFGGKQNVHGIGKSVESHILWRTVFLFSSIIFKYEKSIQYVDYVFLFTKRILLRLRVYSFTTSGTIHLGLGIRCNEGGSSRSPLSPDFGTSLQVGWLLPASITRKYLKVGKNKI